MPVLRSVPMICPVDRDRNKRRSRRYSCPRRRAPVTSGLGPFAVSYSSSPSSTQIVVERRSLAARGLAVPAAVAQLFLKQTVGEAIACLAKIRADRKHPSVDTGL